MLFRLKRPAFNLFDSKINLFLLILFLLVFPKGGIKLAGIPLTWGYLLLGIFSIGALLRKCNCVQKERFYIFLSLVPFLIISAATMALNGIESLGMTVSFWISFFFLPFIFFILLAKDIETFDEEHFFKCFKNGVFFIAAYGIALFIMKQATGRFLEIPLLTINLGDLGEMENKCNNRGIVSKLISTYNNGNIFGVCLLILLPLYSFLEKSGWRRKIVKFSLFLTLSRTVWIGLLFHELCYQWMFTKNKKVFFFTLLGTLGILIISMTILSFLVGFELDFFTDLSFGGRRAQFDSIFNSGWVSKTAFTGIGEITYMGILNSFGWIGLAAFLLGMAGPLFFQILSRRITLPQKCIALGLLNYLLISASDGALLLLPTLAFYWFMLSLLYRKNISLNPKILPTKARPPHPIRSKSLQGRDPKAVPVS